MIVALQAEAAELKDRLLRAHAEVENIRKRSEREKEETAKYAVTRLARDIVSLEKALGIYHVASSSCRTDHHHESQTLHVARAVS